MSTGGGGSSSETQWNPTEPPGPGTRRPHTDTLPGTASRTAAFFSVTSHHPTSARPVSPCRPELKPHQRSWGLFPEKPTSKWSRSHHAYFFKKSFKIYILKGCHFARTSSRKEDALYIRGGSQGEEKPVEGQVKGPSPACLLTLPRSLLLAVPG